MKRLSPYLVILVFLLPSCGALKTSNLTQVDESKYRRLAMEKLGEEDVTFTINGADTYVLCTSEVKGTVQQPRNNINYLVINLSDNTIVLENRVNGGTVSWYNEKIIQVYLTPGVIRKDQTRDDFITLYNVETGKSYPKNLKQTH